LEKIGDFARRCEVTIKTLRYYDELGLLVPDHIDPSSGYRYYGADKVGEMERIGELKQLGFPLDEIKLFCSAKDDGTKRRVIFERQRALEKLASDTARQLDGLAAIEQKLNIRKGEPMTDFNTKFVDDEAVIGRWELVDIVDKRENFVPGRDNYRIGHFFKEIYFLPGGQEYWIFSWTKGYVKTSTGDGTMISRYELGQKGGGQYMFIYNHDEILVLRQADKKRYTKAEISKSDNIDLPFTDDPRVLGKWSVVDFVENVADFDPARRRWAHELYYKSAEFLPGGELRCEMESAFPARWTKGATLLKNGNGATAPAYEIHDYDGTKYLFIEWKSGDYIWGDRQPCRYVFRRDA